MVEENVEQVTRGLEAAKNWSEGWAIQASQMQRDGKCLLVAGPGVRELFRDAGE